MALDKSSLLALIAANLPDNSSKLINAKKLRDTLTELVDSDYNLIDNFDLVRLAERVGKSYRTGECAVIDGIIYQANTQTATSFVPAEWDDLSVELGTALDDYLLKANGIELDNKKKVKLPIDSSLSGLDTGIYDIQALAVSSGPLQEYPQAGKATLKVWKSDNTTDTIYEYISNANPPQKWIRNLGDQWYNDTANTDQIVFTSGITRVADEVFLGGDVSDIDFQAQTAESTFRFNGSRIRTTRGLETIEGSNSFKVDSNGIALNTDSLFLSGVPLDNNVVQTNKVATIDPNTGLVTMIDSQELIDASNSGSSVFNHTIESVDWIADTGSTYSAFINHNWDDKDFLIEGYSLSGGSVSEGTTILPEAYTRINTNQLKVTVDDNTLRLRVILSRGGIDTLTGGTSDIFASNGLNKTNGVIGLGGTLTGDTTIAGGLTNDFTIEECNNFTVQSKTTNTNGNTIIYMPEDSIQLDLYSPNVGGEYVRNRNMMFQNSMLMSHTNTTTSGNTIANITLDTVDNSSKINFFTSDLSDFTSLNLDAEQALYYTGNFHSKFGPQSIPDVEWVTNAITSSGGTGGGTITGATNGLNVQGKNIALGGTIDDHTNIVAGGLYQFNVTNLSSWKFDTKSDGNNLQRISSDANGIRAYAQDSSVSRSNSLNLNPFSSSEGFSLETARSVGSQYAMGIHADISDTNDPFIKFNVNSGSGSNFRAKITEQGMAYFGNYAAAGIAAHGDRWVPDAGWVNQQIILSGGGGTPAVTPFVNVGDQSGTYNWDVSVNPKIIINLTGDTDITITGNVNGGEYELDVTRDGLAAHTVDITNTIKTPNNGSGALINSGTVDGNDYYSIKDNGANLKVGYGLQYS
jgi:hypothetical protein